MVSCGQNCLQIMIGSIGTGITNVELVGSGTREWFLNTVAEAVYTLKEKWKRLSVGCSKLDGFLQGGVAVQGITEIAGESSSGKTQLCLQMALTVQYPVINGGLSGGWCFLLPFVACSETLPLCLIRQHVTNICRKVEVCFHSFLQCMELIIFRPWLFYSSERSTHYPLDRRLDGPTSWSEWYRREKSCCPDQ